MKRHTFVFFRAFFLLCAATLAWSSLANATTADQNATLAGTNDVAHSYPLDIGDYLTTEFINHLRQTHSEVKARAKSDYREYMSVEIVRNELSFALMGGFHSGLGGFGVNSAGKIKTIDEFKNQYRGFRIISQNEFTVTHKGKQLTYQYVGNIQKYITRNTIAGNFKDGQGRNYVFTEDGQATFPERSFRFVFLIDYAGDDVDAIAEIPPGNGESIQNYGFKFVGEELQLFEMGGPMGDDPEPNPFARLTRINETTTP